MVKFGPRSESELVLQNFVGAYVFFHSWAEKPVLNVAALSHNLCHCRKIQFVQNVLSFFQSRIPSIRSGSRLTRPRMRGSLPIHSWSGRMSGPQGK